MPPVNACDAGAWRVAGHTEVFYAPAIGSVNKENSCLLTQNRPINGTSRESIANISAMPVPKVSLVPILQFKSIASSDTYSDAIIIDLPLGVGSTGFIGMTVYWSRS